MAKTEKAAPVSVDLAPGGTMGILTGLEERRIRLGVNLTRAVAVRAGLRLLAGLGDRELEDALREQWRAEADQRHAASLRRLGGPGTGGGPGEGGDGKAA